MLVFEPPVIVRMFAPRVIELPVNDRFPVEADQVSVAPTAKVLRLNVCVFEELFVIPPPLTVSVFVPPILKVNAPKPNVMVLIALASFTEGAVLVAVVEKIATSAEPGGPFAGAQFCFVPQSELLLPLHV